MRSSILFFLLLLLCWSAPGQDPPLAITGATLVNVADRSVLENAVVLIREGRIEAIGVQGSIAIPEGTERIDAAGKFLIPGLVDAHIHLFQSGGLYTRPDAIDLREYRPYERERQWLRDNAADLLRRYLACGITTVVDVGGPLANYPLRDSMNRDAATASVYLTGPLVSTYQPEAFRIDDAPIIKVDSREAARALVRRQLPFQPDLIKVWYIARTPKQAKDNYGIVKATIGEAHAHGLRVAVHATQLETARLAVQAGADLLVHSVDDALVDDDFMRLLLDRNVVYCPTLVVSKNYGSTFLQEPDLDPVDFRLSNPYALGTLFDLQHLPEGLERLASTRARADALRARYAHQDSIMAENLRRLHAAGVPIATGTDAGNIGTLHATSYYDELEAMAAAGLGLWDLLQASTVNGARAIGKAGAFGALEVGQRADLVALNDDPLTALDHWQTVGLVVHEGAIHYPDSLLSPTPEDLAQQQLNAYNARDIDAFLAPYADDVEIYNFPNELRSKGIEAMRENYAGFFKRAEDLHCELVNRIVQGNTVIDQERVIVRRGEPPIEAIAVYKIEGGKIARVYFIR